MKKLLIIAGILTIAIVACVKTQDVVTSNPQIPLSGDPSAITIPGGNSACPGCPWHTEKNHCYGCGTEYNWKYHCVDVGNEGGWLECMQFALFCKERDSLGLNMLTMLNTQGAGISTTFAANTVRDSFLDRFDKGREYLDYYYYISKVAYDNGGISLVELPAHISFANSTISAANTLINGAPTDIPFTLGYKTDAMAMIASYRSKCSYTRFQNILDSITSDLNIHTGLTKAQIYALY